MFNVAAIALEVSVLHAHIKAMISEILLSRLAYSRIGIQGESQRSSKSMQLDFSDTNSYKMFLHDLLTYN